MTRIPPSRSALVVLLLSVSTSLAAPPATEPVLLADSPVGVQASPAQDEPCPCWTLEELQAIRTTDCGACMNWIELGGPPETDIRCVQINGVSKAEKPGDDTCHWGRPDRGWVMVWDQASVDIGGTIWDPPGCYMWDTGMGVDPSRVVSPLTQEQAEACASQIVEHGMATAAANPGALYGCLEQCFPLECRMHVLKSTCSNALIRCESDDPCYLIGACSVDASPCETDVDCSLFGFCSITSDICSDDVACPTMICSQTGGPCETDDDCPGGGFPPDRCLISQTCNDQQNPQSCLGHSVGSCGDRVGFTSQPFDVVSGLMSELLVDSDYGRASCHGTNFPLGLFPFEEAAMTIDDPTAPPPPDDAVYIMMRAVEGLSCLSHDDSSLDPDPRDLLDAICP